MKSLTTVIINGVLKLVILKISLNTCLVNKNSVHCFFTEILEDERDFANSIPAAQEATQIKKETIDIGRSILCLDDYNSTFYFT